MTKEELIAPLKIDFAAEDYFTGVLGNRNSFFIAKPKRRKKIDANDPANHVAKTKLMRKPLHCLSPKEKAELVAQLKIDFATEVELAQPLPPESLLGMNHPKEITDPTNHFSPQFREQEHSQYCVIYSGKSADGLSAHDRCIATIQKKNSENNKNCRKVAKPLVTKKISKPISVNSTKKKSKSELLVSEWENRVKKEKSKRVGKKKTIFWRRVDGSFGG